MYLTQFFFNNSRNLLQNESVERAKSRRRLAKNSVTLQKNIKFRLVRMQV